MVGRYEILREIGRGGTAVVYLARQTELGRLVALKELSLPQGSDEAATRRFLRESRLVAGLNHPNVVTVHDFFERDGSPYIAMEYLERGALRPLMRGLGLARIAGVLEGLLAGLAHAHEHRIVHRDLKPENVMVTHNGAVKIADFGIAKATGETLMTTQLTATGTTIGTPAYMSPEQALGREIGPATDLYALGVMAFEMLAGRPPFGARDTPAAVLLRHVNEPPPALDSLDAERRPAAVGVGRPAAREGSRRPPAERPRRLARAGGDRHRRPGLAVEAVGAAPCESRPRPRPRRCRWRSSSTTTRRPRSGRVRRRARSPRRCLPSASPPPGTPPGGRPPRRPPPRPSSISRMARAALLVGALVAALAAVLAGRSGGGDPAPSTPASATVTPAPVATVARTPVATVARTPVATVARDPAPTATPPVATRTPAATVVAPAAATPAAEEDASGVGDSKSDDPSDDEPDVGEP